VMYAITIAEAPASSPVARWLTTVATLIVAGAFIDTLVRRARHDASAAAANAERMTRIAEVAHRLAALSDIAAARPTVCETTIQMVGAGGAALWELAAEGRALKLSASSGLEPSDPLIQLSVPTAGATQAFVTGRPSWTSGPSATPLCAEFESLGRAPGSCLWQPVLCEQTPIAVLAAYWEDPRALEDRSILTLVDLLAAETAVTLERIGLLTRLETVARTDELTGLPNRRAWQEHLPRELEFARRSALPICVAMLDLDHFKRFNDQRGHQAGDRMLKEMAVAWASQLRGTDFLSRYGGEEFALALPGCGVDDALAVVERLRAAIPIGQSCSAGVACWDGHESAADLLDRADRALYDAKRRGRDRILLAAGAG
jgi:diguanylate cyclase (GGDEF)-like protein